jgi:hypothetical protein
MRSLGMHEEILATIPQADGETMLEVVFMRGTEGQTVVELRHLVWGKGLGWYRQQTLSLDATTASNLLCRLSSVRHRLRSKSDSGQRGNILPFPRRRPQRSNSEPDATEPIRKHSEA